MSGNEWDSTASRLDPLQGGSLLFTTKLLLHTGCGKYYQITQQGTY